MRILITTLSLTIFLVSCATLYGDNTREVTLETEPEGAKIYVNGILYGRTPGSILVADANYSGQKITLKKNGYKDQEILVHTMFQSVGYWNLVFPPDFLIDMGTGTMFKLDPKDLNMRLHLQKLDNRQFESRDFKNTAIESKI